MTSLINTCGCEVRILATYPRENDVWESLGFGLESLAERLITGNEILVVTTQQNNIRVIPWEWAYLKDTTVGRVGHFA